MRRAVKRRIIGGPFEGSSQHLHTGNEENDEECESNLATDFKYNRCHINVRQMRYKPTNLLELLQVYRQICVHIQGKISTELLIFTKLNGATPL